MEIASWLGPYAGGTEYDEGRPFISAIDGPGGPIITADHLTRDRTIDELHDGFCCTAPDFPYIFPRSTLIPFRQGGSIDNVPSRGISMVDLPPLHNPSHLIIAYKTI